MTSGAQLVIELTELEWIVASAAVVTAEIGGEHVGDYDVLERTQHAVPFAGLVTRLQDLPTADELTLHVTDQEFTLLLIAVERALFRGGRTPWVRVRGRYVWLDSEISPRRLQEAVQSLFAHLRQIPHRPTAVLDGGVIV